MNRVIIVFILAIVLAFALEGVRHMDSNGPVIIAEPWDHSPITVYIDDKDVPQHYSPSYREEVLNALTYWENGGNGQLVYRPEFQVVETDNADILIMWVDNLEKDVGASSGVAGFTRPYIVNGRFERADIVLETGNYEGYAWRQYGDSSMEYIAAHEMGHALGLGHSDDRSDIMYPRYNHRDNLNPLLFNSTRYILLALIIGAALMISYHGTGWLRYRKQRKKLEDDVFSDSEGDGKNE
ncbi:matrixin family metalloprotease [Methanolobus bombayensis]|uniref:matrixin family metalloprotease n=1 Tax=Methanolobus bombayensis TaxID=38023 RepID=UPI001FD7BB5E|nr:matrixin family metalloprotease [Methanolobus bombayensis]MBP1909696.1 putative Zn-dependent protease [Methanolobus bombayensis]